MPMKVSNTKSRSRLHFLNVLDASFQGHLIGVTIVFALEFGGLAVLVGNLLRHDLKSEIMKQSASGIANSEIVDSLLLRYGVQIGVVGLAILILHLTALMVLSNRVAGPLKRVERLLSGIPRGEPGPTAIVFRQGDYFPGFAKSLSVVLGAMDSPRVGNTDSAADRF